MDRPHGRNKRTVSGSAQVSKGKRVSTGGSVGGQRSPFGGSADRGTRSTGSRDSDSREPGSRGIGKTAGALGLLAIFAFLPKKVRKVVVILLAVVVLFSVFRSCAGSSGVIGGSDGTDTLTLTEVSAAPSGAQMSSSGYVNPFSTSVPYSSSADSTAAPAAQSTALDTAVASGARSKRVTPLGNGQDTVTIMVYMCGTDLESKYGMATSDLSEMTKATISDKLNVIVETGGCKSWKNSVVSSTYNEIYKVCSGGLERLESNFGTLSMTDPENLTNFIDYCEENYPADRNILILWDHGGGSISGYGYDEKQSSSDSMTLVELNTALSDAGCVFDWIGFDACLMANLETALVCADYADYLIASEEVEPGTGWYYTDWLNAISSDTSLSTPELAKELIDSYISVCKKSSSSAEVTLSAVDLAEFQGTVPEPLNEFSSALNTMIDSGSYSQITEARSGVRQFSESSKINQVDLVDLALRIGTDEANALAEAVQSCVKYNGSTISRSYGMSIYFPYESLSGVNTALSTYSSLGMDEEYTKCIKSFASLGVAGQVSHSASQSDYSSYGSYADLFGDIFGSYSSSGSSSPSGFLNGNYSNFSGSQSSGYSISASDLYGLLSSFTGRSLPQEYSWVDTELVAASAESISASILDAGRVYASEKDGRQVLELTDDEWALINTVELNVFVDDGEGYIDLGRDNVFEFDGDDLLLEYDGTWLTVDGHAAAYYLVSDKLNDDGTWTTVGRIPALLNGECVNLRVVFDDENPYGVISGAYPLYNSGETDTAAKGEIALEAGDELQFICDYYTYDGSYDASYTLGEAFTLERASPELANTSLDTDDLRVTYRLTDLYGNYYWVEVQ